MTVTAGDETFIGSEDPIKVNTFNISGDLRIKADGDPGDIAVLVALSVFRSIAWATFLLLLIGLPLLVGRALRARRPWTPELTAIVYCWGLYFAYSFGLSMIYMAGRFLPAVLTAGLMGALFTGQRLYDGFMRDRFQEAAGLAQQFVSFLCLVEVSG